MDTELHDKVYQIYVGIDVQRHTVWRRIDIPADYTLMMVRDVLGRAMGWPSQSGGDFYKDRICYTGPGMWEPGEESLKEMRTVRLGEVLEREGDGMEYSMGPSESEWYHWIVLERIMQRDPGTDYPVLLSGRNACPFGDYQWGPKHWPEFLEALGDDGHEHHDYSRLVMRGEQWDPEAFDLQEAQRRVGMSPAETWSMEVVDVPETSLKAILFLDESTQQLACWDVAPASQIKKIAWELLHSTGYEVAMRAPATLLAMDGPLGKYLADRTMFKGPMVLRAVLAEVNTEWELDMGDWAVEMLHELNDMQPYRQRKVTPDVVGRFFEAAAELYRTAIWMNAQKDQVFGMSCQGHDEIACVRVLGHRSGLPGLLWTRNVDDHRALGGTITTGLPVYPYDEKFEGSLMLHFVRGADVPAPVRKEISEHGWPVAGAKAYPRLKVVNSGGLSHPGRKDLERATIACSAMADLGSKLRGRISSFSHLLHWIDQDGTEIAIEYPHPELAADFTVFSETDLSALGEDDDKVDAAVEFINNLMGPDDEE